MKTLNQLNSECLSKLFGNGRVMKWVGIAKLWGLALVVLALFSLVSCSDDDGDWAPMRWNKTDYEVINEDGSRYYTVPQAGQVYTFTCKNYKGIWIAGMDITEDGVSSHYPPKAGLHAIDLDNIQVQIVDNVVTVSVAPRGLKWYESENQPNYYHLYVTAGDIFYTFNFKQ